MWAKLIPIPHKNLSNLVMVFVKIDMSFAIKSIVCPISKNTIFSKIMFLFNHILLKPLSLSLADIPFLFLVCAQN